MFRFEKLDVWRKSVEFATLVYTVSQAFPDAERFGITSQIRRSAVSVSANMAEGSSRASDRDFSRFVEISYGSLLETISHVRIAQALGYVGDDDTQCLERAAEELARMVSGLRNSLGRWRPGDDPE